MLYFTNPCMVRWVHIYNNKWNIYEYQRNEILLNHFNWNCIEDRNLDEVSM